MRLPKVYDPKEYEEEIYALWEKSKAFEPKNRGSDDSFSIVIPPPNANGNLHLGHGLTLALEDIAVRYHRMKGEAALLLPGADHAGFETQVVYEKQLAKEGKSRFDFTREELYQQIWEFVAQNRENYESQFRKLGASLDWSRYVFTLDQKVVTTAYSTFKKMWDDGLIYRGERLVNFCTFHGTGFADIEVAYKEVKGHLWHIRYPLTDGSGEVVVATTRPETMLGDTAVAVHPEDPRYQKFIGKTVELPLTNREVPVLADDMVEQAFGTGAVKITPAHDPNDYELAGRHDLPMISVIDHEGNITHEGGEAYRGLSVKDARKQVVADLDQLGLIDKVENHVHNVGHCYKCGTVIEPLLREQWFIDMEQLAEPAIKALQAEKIKFHPEAKREQLIRYLEGLRDWNISRQIAWGIPIPAFQNVEEPSDWIFDERAHQEEIEVNGKKYRRDPDVFDTWFSSSSWPYATLDYPNGTDFEQFYPLSLMETAADILYPWVSRMIMFGLYVTGKVPFKEVYLHGLIQDEHGAKMSKSKGNVIDPMIKIDTYGSDAFRMGMVADESAGNNRPYDESKIIGARNFANKLWNIARFIESVIGDDSHLKTTPQPDTAADHWILFKLQHLTEVVSANLDNYRFAEAYENIYHFVWDDFADWYLEASKTEPNRGVLGYVLESVLKIAHPFAPFLTETIWQTLAWEKDTILAVSSWPEATKADHTQAEAFEAIRLIVSETRYISTSLNLGKPILTYTANPFISGHASVIKTLGKLSDVTEVETGAGLQLTQTKHSVWLAVERNQIQAFAKDLQAKLADYNTQIKNLEARLKNKAYVEKAPTKLVNETKAQLEALQATRDKAVDELKRFN